MDQDSGLVHHVEVTSAKIHDVTVVPQLLTGEETVVYGDSGYLGAEKREDAVIRNIQGRKIRTEYDVCTGKSVLGEQAGLVRLMSLPVAHI